MKYYLAVFSSITYANQIKKIMERQLGFVSLMHAPATLCENGCAYCLRFRPELLDKVLSLAKINNIKIRSLYLEDDHQYVKL